VLVVYGTGSRERSDVCVKILEGLKESGHITDICMAFSKDDPENRIHVQDRLRENGPTVWRYWQDPTCRLFYAGESSIVGEEIKQILFEITIAEGHVSEATAREFNNSHHITLVHYGREGT
jgi:sulfite reductase alpha subunit-like flavoprotein